MLSRISRNLIKFRDLLYWDFINIFILLTKKKDIKKLRRKKNIPSILLNIVEIATFLDLQEDLEWAKYEISGYPDPLDNAETQKTIDYPLYRRISYHLTPNLKDKRSLEYFLSTHITGFWFYFPINLIVIKK